MKDVDKIFKSVKNEKNLYFEDDSDNLKKIINVQRAVRKFLNLLNHTKTKEMYAKDFNQQFFSNMRLDKINELKNKIITKIKTNNIPYKNNELNFQEVKQ